MAASGHGAFTIHIPRTQSWPQLLSSLTPGPSAQRRRFYYSNRLFISSRWSIFNSSSSSSFTLLSLTTIVCVGLRIPGATFEPPVEACLAWFYFRDRHILPHRIGAALAAAQTEWRDRRMLARRRALCLPTKVHLSFQCRRKSKSHSRPSIKAVPSSARTTRRKESRTMISSRCRDLTTGS